MKRIAVFGDTHGHLRLMFQLCRLWQREHGVHLDVVLQCGDLGFFPEALDADRATRRYAKRDPEELAFARYFRHPYPPERDDLLVRTLKGPPHDLNTVRCPVIWCNGNHEDHQRLKRMVGSAVLAPVDAFGVIHYLQSGQVTDVAGIRVAAIGGAPEGERYDDARRVGDDACGKLLSNGEESFHVLLTHASPREVGGASDTWGSDMLRIVDELCKPVYHFYGHHETPIPPGKVDETQCYWLNDVAFERNHDSMVPYGRLEEGCMGILSWTSENEHRFEVLREDWMKDVTWSTWRHV